jgi:hypothetical protein
VEIIHNTIARNDSLATAGGAFSAGPDQSTPQPAGIVSRGHSPLLGTLGGTSFSNPTLLNSIVWENRSSYFGILPGSTPAAYGLMVNPTTPYWDLGVVGATGTLTAESTTLTGTTADFVLPYVTGSRNPTIVIPEPTSILTPVAFDEGGTFIRPIFGPLTLQNPSGLALFGNYHVTAGLEGANVPLTLERTPLLFDIDGEPRPDNGVPATQIVAPHRGADQKTATDAPTNPLP